MKQLLVLVVLALLAVPIARGEGPDDQYLNIYNLIQEADSLAGQPSQALSKYLQAQMALQRLQRIYPEWNTKVVNFRLNYLSLKIDTLSAKAPPVRAGTNAAPLHEKTATAQSTAEPSEAERQVQELSQRLRQMEAEKIVLEAKLKEALSAQPAVLDPHELSNALAQVKSLQKENDLLKVTLAQEKARAAAPPAARPQTPAEAQTNPSQAQHPQVSPGAENSSLTALQAENALLRRQIVELRSSSAGTASDAGARLAEAQKQIAALQSDKETLRLEKAALEGRIKQAAIATNNAPATPQLSESARVKQLQGERDQLQKKLDTAMKELYSRKGKELTARIEGMEGQILALKTRLEVFEARQVPYTAEELALLTKPEPQLAKEPEVRPARKSIRELPPGTTALVAEAQKFFSAKEFEKAEKNYLQVLSRDQSNVPTLANLATIQMQLNRLDEAEKNIQAALKVDPEDAYSLMVLGQIKFKQEKYDDALDALSRAAKLDPQNAQVQNLLGLTLSQKGLRGPAETALRKAIQIDPGMGDAHNNLAVIYLSQQPPLIELARWHYQRARAAGNAPNPFLEKAFQTKQAASTGH